MDEHLDILQPPDFLPSGVVKTRDQAMKDGDWVGIFNLWIVARSPVPSIIYQQRGPDRSWGPNLLDVAVGGHYQASETKLDGLREAEEEVGKHYKEADITYLGRKMHVGESTDSGQKKNIIELYLVEDNSPLESYNLDPKEVHAICSCPVAELLKVHHDPSYSFPVDAIRHDGQPFSLTVRKDSFPHNWDDYHYKIAMLASRYFDGDTQLMY